MSICVLQQVDKFYTSKAGKVHALKQVNCEVDQGEFIVLAGPSGSGKTTLANIFGFLDDISTGHYVFQGQDISSYTAEERTTLRRSHVGFVFQSFNLMPILTVQENVSIAVELQGVRPKDAAKKSLEALDMVAMADYAQRYPNELSGRTTATSVHSTGVGKKPAMLIADEPTASLDSHNTQEIINLMVTLNKSMNSICIVCTHDERVISIAPRLIHIQDGIITEKSESK